MKAASPIENTDRCMSILILYDLAKEMSVKPTERIQIAAANHKSTLIDWRGEYLTVPCPSTAHWCDGRKKEQKLKASIKPDTMNRYGV
jgi:hypothetical protein